jgi:hypothetical protein
MMLPATTPNFDGETYRRALDHARLSGQLKRVYLLMLDGQWGTLRGIAAEVLAPEASVSARLRDLKKPKFGGFNIERKRIDDGGNGLHVYRMVA